MAGGRPTNYDPSYAKRIKRLCLLGCPVREIAEEFGVSVATLYNWREEHQEFLEQWVSGLKEADAKVAQSLFRRATGYKHKAVKIFANATTGDIVKVPYTERFPPDVGAAKFWLVNRDKARWKPESAFGKPEENPDGEEVTINIKGGLPDDA